MQSEKVKRFCRHVFFKYIIIGTNVTGQCKESIVKKNQCLHDIIDTSLECIQLLFAMICSVKYFYCLIYENVSECGTIKKVTNLP